MDAVYNVWTDHSDLEGGIVDLLELALSVGQRSRHLARRRQQLLRAAAAEIGASSSVRTADEAPLTHAGVHSATRWRSES